MEENVFLVIDYERICRLCLNTKGVMSDIFNCANTDEEISLQEQILLATGLNVGEGDDLPKNICHKCRYVVEVSYELRKVVSKANKLLIEASDGNAEKYYNDGNTVTPMKECIENIDEPSLLHNTPENKNNLKISQDNGIAVIEKDDKELERVLKQDARIKVNNESDSNSRPEVYEKQSKTRERRAAPKHLTCQICLKVFPNKHKVQQHVEAHYTNSTLKSYLECKRPYRCEQCDEPLATKYMMIDHHRKHLDVNPFICDHPNCSFVGKNASSIREHRTSHGARSWVCERCGAAFRRRGALAAHARRHAPGPAPGHAPGPAPALACPRAACRVVCRNLYTYRAHLNYHDRGRRFKCPRLGCPKGFYSRAALAAHERSHSDQRIYACHLCISTYSTRSLLNRHVREHARRRGRSSRCDRCGEIFHEYAAFHNHRLAAHGPWLPHKCHACNRGYQSETKLQKHVEICPIAIHIARLMGARADTNGQASQGVGAQDSTGTTETTVCKSGKMMDDDVLDRFKGQSLLVQPGDVNSLAVDNAALQKLPADGVLYIEVDPDSDDPAQAQPWSR